MITDQETNFVYLSSLIRERPGMKNFWHKLEKTLKKANIKYSFIENTNDIWCRDYMPLQITSSEFVQFKYNPSYCNNAKYRHLITDTDKVRAGSEPIAGVRNSSLVLDGGNVVKSGKVAILTERIFKENGGSREEILQHLQQRLGVESVHLLPEQPYDMTGHSDGMVRLLNDRTLLVADFQGESTSWKAKYSQALQRTNLKLIDFPGVTTDIKNNDGDYTAIGCYINFAWIGNVILFPQFDLPEDKEALKETKRLFKDCLVIPVASSDLAIDGGVLNCATWNVKQ
jgi:agmatine deiminase